MQMVGVRMVGAFNNLTDHNMIEIAGNLFHGINLKASHSNNIGQLICI